MNKQEALEAVLRRMREWEQPDEETRKETLASVMNIMGRARDRLLDLRDAEVAGVDVEYADMEAQLINVGAAALYMLVTEVNVVEVPAAGAGASSPAPAQDRPMPKELRGAEGGTLPVLGIGAGVASYPRVVNGQIGRRL